jgi:hypothetical protein
MDGDIEQAGGISLIDKRLSKSQQMRWDPRSAHPSAAGAGASRRWPPAR